MKTRRIAIVIALVVLVSTFYHSGLHTYLDFAYLKESHTRLTNLVGDYPQVSMLVYFVVYILVAALSIPGALILTLAAGLLFGFWWGVLLVSFASTIGATLAMLVARYLLRSMVERKFRSQLLRVNKGVEANGRYYLFTLRLIPVFPFFAVNLIMALTRMRALDFYLVSQIGMFPATMVYVNAGYHLAELQQVGDILSPAILGSLVLIGLLPWMLKGLLALATGIRRYRQWQKPTSFTHDLIVLGAGSGGLVAAIIASSVNARVALVEKEKMGGDCLNTGCVPSKALIRSASFARDVKTAQALGFDVPELSFRFPSLMARVKRVIQTLAPHDSEERFTQMGVDVHTGEGRLVSPWVVQVNGRELAAKKIIIATGASPFIPRVKGLSEVGYLTSKNLWTLETLPARLLVLGGGAIGVELAQAFARLGSSVTLIEALPRILPGTDAEVSAMVEDSLVRDHINVLVQTRVVSVRRTAAGKLAVVLGVDGRQELGFDDILVATGRKADVSGFGLESLGLLLTDNGQLAVNAYLQTSLPNIYAVGDVAGPYQLTNAASHMAWYATVNALLSPFWRFRINYECLPNCIFTSPQVATLGVNEDQARNQNLPYEVTVYDMSGLDRAVMDESGEGMIRVLTRPGSDKLLGVTIVSAHAGEQIAEFALAMKHGLGLNAILATPHAYPTWMEANKAVAGIWRRANAPAWLLAWTQKYFNWKRRLPWF